MAEQAEPALHAPGLAKGDSDALVPKQLANVLAGADLGLIGLAMHSPCEAGALVRRLVEAAQSLKGSALGPTGARTKSRSPLDGVALARV